MPEGTDSGYYNCPNCQAENSFEFEVLQTGELLLKDVCARCGHETHIIVKVNDLGEVCIEFDPNQK